MGKFSSRAPFEILEDNPLTRALLLRPFRGIVLKQPTQTAYCEKISHKNLSATPVEEEQTCTQKNRGYQSNDPMIEKI